ncbi:MAG TPA: VTT domain-containing protein [Stellaceae bacterium]|nr:VTT domain-containing protein [Stellaceae bacterium]
MTPDDAPSPMSALRLTGRVLAAGLVLVGMVLVLTHRSVLNPADIKSTIGAAPLAPAIFVLGHIAASLLFVPRTLLALVAGLLFGSIGGIAWATVGSTLGAVAGFLLARYINSGLIEPEKLPKLGPLLVKAESGGWRAVAVMRLIPVIPHPITNYALGLTRLSLSSYTLGSLIGQIPMTLAYVEFGAAGNEALSGSANWLLPSLLGLAVLLASFALPRLVGGKS